MVDFVFDASERINVLTKLNPTFEADDKGTYNEVVHRDLAFLMGVRQSIEKFREAIHVVQVIHDVAH